MTEATARRIERIRVRLEKLSALIAQRDADGLDTSDLEREYETASDTAAALSAGLYS